MTRNEVRRSIQIVKGIWRTGIIQNRQNLERLDGEVIRETLQSLGPTFVKLGQFLSSRDDLLNREVRAQLECLQDRGEELPFDVIKNRLEEEWGDSIETILHSIDPDPIGVASIGQVHKAVLKTGEMVAVKIRKPGVASEVLFDIRLLKKMYKSFSRWLNAFNKHSYDTFMKDFSQSLKNELDFEHEARNLLKFSKLNESENVIVPKVYNHFSTEKVMVMEYIEGDKLTQIDYLAKDQRRAVASHFANHLFAQILVHGFFHGDPHAGNVLLSDGKLVYLDFGNMGRILPPTKKWFEKVIFHLINEDFEKLAEVVSEDIRMDPAKKRRLVYELSTFVEDHVKAPIKQAHFGSILLGLVEILRTFSIQVPGELVMVGNTLIKAEKTIATLHPELQLSDVLKNAGKRMVQEKYNPEKVAHDLKNHHQEMMERLYDIPIQAHRAIQNLSEGKTNLTIRLQEEHRLFKRIDRMISLFTISVILLSFSIISTGIIVSLNLSSKIISSNHAAMLGITSSLVVTLILIIIIITLFRKKKRI